MALWLACLAGARAGEAEDQYIEIYKAIRQADALNEGGQPSQALAKYAEALTTLQAFHKAYPDWNIIAVNYRLDYLTSKMAALSAKLPPPSKSLPAQTHAPRAPSDAASPSAPPQIPADWTNQLNALKEQARQLQGEKGQLQMDKDRLLADKGLLEEKLKEALAVRPAAVDPRELANAEQKINALQKENDLLSISLEQAKARNPAVPPPSPAVTPAPSAVAPAPSAVAPTPSAVMPTPSAVAPAPSAVTPAPSAVTPAPSAVTPAPSADAQRLKQLEWQRDDLARKLDAANKALAARKGKGSSRAETQNEINNLRAKLEALEAQKAPYTAEELALFKPSEPALAHTNTVRKSVREIPAGMAALVAQARNYFSSKQYSNAEALYVQVLREDEKNVGALSDLAFIQIKLNRLDAAEKHLKEALAIAPDDPYTLMIVGRLRMSQKSWDDALAVLSRAAQGDPQNAEVQNDLGIVLSEKGQRDPAEAAFRKAVLLQPGYGDPHNNLAIFYLTAQPPQMELARWHYQKALAANLPRNPEIERLLASRKAAAR
jgi:tetratricopeptide (TPR) repeat protein